MDGLRDFLKSFWGKLILLACLLPLVFVGMEGLFHGGDNDPSTVASVGDTHINQARYQEILTNLRTQNPNLDEEALQKMALDGAIDRALLDTHATRMGLSLSKDTITKLLQTQPIFLDENGRFSNDLFARYLQQNGLNKDALFARFNEDSARALVGEIGNGALAPTNLVNALTADDHKTRPVQLYRLDLNQYMDKAVVTDAQIDAQIAKAPVVSEEMVDLAWFELDPSKMAVQVDDKDLQKAYERKSQESGREFAHILFTGDDAKIRADQTYAKLQTGDDFAMLAQSSDDLESGKKGGLLGRLDMSLFGDKADLVRTATQSLKTGEYSAPVQTNFGYQIFKLIKSDVPSFDAIKDELHAQAIQEKRAEKFADAVADINAKAGNGESIQSLAKNYGVQVQSLNDFVKKDNKTALNLPAIIKEAFDPMLIQDSMTSNAIMVGERALWVMPSKYRPKRTLSADEARPIVARDLRIQEARKLALADAQKIANGEIQVQFVDLGEIGTQNPMLSPAESASLFRHNGAWALSDTHGASVLKVGDIKMGAIDDKTAAQNRTLVAQMAGRADLIDFLRYLRTLYKVHINENAEL